MKRLSAALAILLGLNASAMAQSTPFLGQIMIFAGTFCPTGWAVTAGQLMPINQNQALFSLLGTTYGGDGRTTFALPKTQPIFTETRAAFTECIALQGVYPSRS